ncbi:DUF126 domain-containing protein [Candidatus Micrarchaeota archaeon]|nr:DUF126 domain-containing protein [Candidatus Micrarchaeota archaeon]
MEIFKGREIFAGKASGELLFSSMPISFYGGVDATSGIVVEKGHPLEGKCMAGKVLAFPNGKGSTVGSYVLYRLKKAGKAPAGIINLEAETIVAVGAIISEIPMMDKVEFEKLEKLDGKKVRMDASGGKLEI